MRVHPDGVPNTITCIPVHCRYKDQAVQIPKQCFLISNMTLKNLSTGQHSSTSLPAFIMNINLSRSVKLCTYSFWPESFENNSFLIDSYRGQCSKTCFSSSSSPRLQTAHFRSSKGVFGWVYRPVSTAKLCALILILV